MVVYSGTGPSMYVMLARFDRLGMSDSVIVCFTYIDGNRYTKRPSKMFNIIEPLCMIDTC